MAKKFNPPSSSALASVDHFADCEYPQDLTEIVGIVALEYQGGWPGLGEFEVHIFEFTAWYRLGHPVVEQPLKILRPVPDFKKALQDFEAGAIYHLRVLIGDGQTRAVFAEKLDLPVDGVANNLQAIADRLNRRVVVQTDRFGPLKLARETNCFEAETDWNGQTVTLQLVTYGDPDIAEQLKTAEALFADAAAWGEKVRQFAVHDRLELASEWQDRPVTAEEFLARMQMESISIDSDGWIEFWHQDGDLFFGHWITISGSLIEGLIKSDIPG
jgi:hypothetical protein